MNHRHTSKLALLGTGLALLATGCIAEIGTESEAADEPVASAGDAIIGGTATSLRPEIGRLRRFGRTSCSATLIAPRYAVTAAQCLDPTDFQNTIVDPNDRLVLVSTTNVTHEFSVNRYYSYGSHFSEKVWTGLTSDMALIRLNTSVPSSLAKGATLATRRSTSSTAFSTRFGHGCETPGGPTGQKRFRSFQGLISNMLCAGDSGGPTMLGQGVNANPIWAINTGTAWDLGAGGNFDVVADAAYHKKQIEATMWSFDGDVEIGINRDGPEYRAISGATMAQCRSACAADPRCREWTHFAAGCSLKDAVGTWGAYSPATSGLSTAVPSAPEANMDRPGNDFSVFNTGSVAACVNACANDYRCEAYSARPAAGGQFTCRLKDAHSRPVRLAGSSSGAKRGLEFNQLRVNATLLHTFTYSTPSPEICQSECSKRANCVSWNYLGPAIGRSPQCFLNSTMGVRVASTGHVTGVRGKEFR